MSEKCTLKESWPTELSPTALFSLADVPAVMLHADHVGGEVYPGWGGRWVPGRAIPVPREGYTGTQTQPVPVPIFNHILALGPTYGQMKAILRF